MGRYLSKGNRWVTSQAVAAIESGDSEELVEAGLLHPSNLEAEEASIDLLKDGLHPLVHGLVRLTDGPGGVARYASYYDILMTNPWGYGTIHTIARGLARLPLKLYKLQLDAETEGSVNEVIQPNRKNIGGRIAWALRYPNGAGEFVDSAPYRQSLWYGTVINKLIHGNALWEIKRNAANEILGFKMHPWEFVEMDEDRYIYRIHKAEYSATGFDFSRLVSRDQEPPEKILTPDQVVHYGLWEGGRRPLNPSPVRALHTTVALYDAVSRHMVSFFNNGARVSGHLRVEPTTGAKAREVIRQEILKLYSGPQSAGKVLISSGDWQAFHREPQFDGIVNLTKFSRDEIFVTYGVPPPVMGVIDRAIMSNAREMRDQYVRDLIGPHAEFLAGAFESQVVDRYMTLRNENVVAQFDVDEQLRPDLWKRATVFRELLLAYTPNELRRIERNPRLLGEADPNNYGETLRIPLNESPMNNIPDYNLRDELNVRRMELEEQRFEHEKENPAPAPAPNGQGPSNEDGGEEDQPSDDNQEGNNDED